MLQWAKTYLIAHSEAPVVRSWPPHICHKANIGKVHQVQPSVEHEPPCLPVRWRKFGAGRPRESKAVDEEKAEDDDDARQNTPPEFLVHIGLYMLFALHEVLHCQIEGV